MSLDKTLINQTLDTIESDAPLDDATAAQVAADIRSVLDAVDAEKARVTNVQTVVLNMIDNFETTFAADLAKAQAEGPLDPDDNRAMFLGVVRQARVDRSLGFTADHAQLDTLRAKASSIDTNYRAAKLAKDKKKP